MLAIDSWAVESAREQLWRSMRVYVREDAGSRPEFVLGGLASGEAQRIFDRLVLGAQAVSGEVWFDSLGEGRPVDEVRDSPTLLERGEITDHFVVFIVGAMSGVLRLPPIGARICADQVQVFWTDEESWAEESVCALVDLVLDLEDSVRGAVLEFQPQDSPDPFLTASRTALRRYAEQRHSQL